MIQNNSLYPYELECQILDKLESLELERDQIIVIKGIENDSDRKALLPFFQHMKEIIRDKYGIEDPFLLLCVGKLDIDVLDEELMAKHGWYRQSAPLSNNEPIEV